MSEKQMYFKVQFDNWDSYSEEKKNFINFFMKDAVVSAGIATDEGGDYYSYMLGRKQDLSISYYNNYGIHFSDDLPHGLIQSNTELDSVITAKPDNIYHKIADVTILPTIDGKINTDSNASLALPSGQSYEVCNVHSTGEYSFPYRTSSFGIKLGDSEIESVHYKIGILDVTNWDEDTPITESELRIDLWVDNRTTIEICDSSSTEDYFPYRKIGHSITEWDGLNYKVRYVYIELCKDGGSYFEDFGVDADTTVDIRALDEYTHEWVSHDWLRLAIVQNSNDDYLAGTVGGQHK